MLPPIAYRQCFTMGLLLLATYCLGGCAREEKIIEIKTPGADIEVRKSADGATIDVDNKRD